MNTHSDGSECREGTQTVPLEFVACCDVFEQQTFACEYDIRYEWRSDLEPPVWVIAIAESAGGGGIEMDFCPHCGTRLVPILGL